METISGLAGTGGGSTLSTSTGGGEGGVDGVKGIILCSPIRVNINNPARPKIGNTTAVMVMVSSCALHVSCDLITANIHKEPTIAATVTFATISVSLRIFGITITLSLGYSLLSHFRTTHI